MKTKPQHQFEYTDSQTLQQSDGSSQENGLVFGMLMAAVVVVVNSYKTIPAEGGQGEGFLCFRICTMKPQENMKVFSLSECLPPSLKMETPRIKQHRGFPIGLLGR